jgi:hypothetical protein
VIKYTSLADRVIISCKYKGACVIKYYKCFKENKRCSVHYYNSVEYNCEFLTSLALCTKLTIKDNPTKKRGAKRLRANTSEKVIEK